MKHKHVNVVIVGAGISGIDAAYNLQTKCPNKSYTILEGRENIGGTWDFFRYPGIRSDSDMCTMGFRFKPWVGDEIVADGSSILNYLSETVEEYGIDEHIHFNQMVQTASWSSAESKWTLGVENKKTQYHQKMFCSPH